MGNLPLRSPRKVERERYVMSVASLCSAWMSNIQVIRLENYRTALEISLVYCLEAAASSTISPSGAITRCEIVCP